MEESKKEWFLNTILMELEHLSLINHTSDFTWLAWLRLPSPSKGGCSFYSSITVSPEGTSAN